MTLETVVKPTVRKGGLVSVTSAVDWKYLLLQEKE